MYFNINEYVILDSQYIEKNNSNNKSITDPISQNKNLEEENTFNNFSTDIIFGPIISKIKDPKFSFSERTRNKLNSILISLLGKSKIDFKNIRNSVFEGIPDELPGLRSILWKLMLNYLPGAIKDWEEYLIERRKDFENIKLDFIDNNLKITEFEEKEKNIYLLNEIVKDVKRTRTHMHFFSLPCKNNINETNSDVMTRILYVFAKLHPDIAYVQGMNEIVAVILYLFSDNPNEFFYMNIEADVFYCFENFILEIKEIFLKEKDETESGIHYRINKIEFLLEFYDKELFDHFKLEKLELHFFMFRWYTLFFTQEFNMPDTLRLWDAIVIQNDKFEFVSYLCLGMIILNRKTLLNKDFSNIMYVMQNLNLLEIDVVELIKKAIEIREKLCYLLQAF